MQAEKEKYHIDLEGILSNLNMKIPEGYIEVNSAKDDTKKNSSDKNTKQKRQ